MQIFSKSGMVGDAVAKMTILGLEQILKLVRASKMMYDDSLDKTEEFINTIVKMIESGDLQVLEDTIEDILEASLFSVTLLHPITLWILIFVKMAIISSALALVDQGLLEEEEALIRARTICSRIWRVYGKVQ